MSKKEATERKNSNVGDIITATESFIEKNQKIVLIVLSTIIVIALSIFLINKFYLNPKELRAAEDFFPAQNWFAMDSLDKALNGDGKYMGFVDVADEYSSTKSGNLAKYYSGICFLKKGNFEEAITYLKKYKSKDIFTDAFCKAALGDAYLELGKINEAIKYYKEASEVSGNDITTPYALMKLGKAYEINKDYSKSVAIYKTIKRDYPTSSEARDIDKYIAHSEASAM